MIYLATHAAGIRDEVRAGGVGLLAGPQTRTARGWLEDAQILAFDNGCFGTRYVGDDAYLAWLTARTDLAPKVLFAVAPDVVGDHDATLARSLPWLPTIRALGYPAAFVAQNGATPTNIPWDQLDVLFLGGDDTFKLGPGARTICATARARGIPIHMGRVNSSRRLSYAAELGCATADGTFLAYGPAINIPRMRRWLTTVADRPPALFDL